MTSSANPARALDRSFSWPPQIRSGADHTVQNQEGGTTSPSCRDSNPRGHILLQEELDDYPSGCFLSSIKTYEFESWDSDSDDDEEEVEWDAGISDFALFDSDRRRAHESNESIPDKWDQLLENQAAALQRSLERSRANSDPDRVIVSHLHIEDVPSLTPDDSPSLRDDLDPDVDSYLGQTDMRPIIPDCLANMVEYDKEQQDNKSHEPIAKPLLPVPVTSKHSIALANRKRERPGLGHSRTMSGHVHAWRQPGRTMYTLGEDPDAEAWEEGCETKRVDSGLEEGRRGRDRR